MDNTERIEYWIEMSEYDLATALAMFSSKRYLYVGFMCHQTIEKALKAVYCKINPISTTPYIHSLSRLARESGVYDDMTNEYKVLVDYLEPLNVEARYPSDREKLMASLTEERCEKVISETEALFEWIKKKL